MKYGGSKIKYTIFLWKKTGQLTEICLRWIIKLTRKKIKIKTKTELKKILMLKNKMAKAHNKT